MGLAEMILKRPAGLARFQRTLIPPGLLQRDYMSGPRFIRVPCPSESR